MILNNVLTADIWMIQERDIGLLWSYLPIEYANIIHHSWIELIRISKLLLIMEYKLESTTVIDIES